MPFYDTQDYNKSVDGMKIIPIQTSELKTIINKHVNYTTLFDVFKSAFISTDKPHEWYINNIVLAIK